MAQTSAEQMRAWQGPALFSYGFRPFFLFGAIWVVLAMLVWLAALTGATDLPTRFDQVSWHAHEFLFGYLSAVLASFLLTAVPNWTGRLPMIGWRLAALFSLWVAGRIAVFFSAYLPVAVAPFADLAFPLVLGGLILREIVAGKNWRRFCRKLFHVRHRWSWWVGYPANRANCWGWTITTIPATAEKNPVARNLALLRQLSDA